MKCPGDSTKLEPQRRYGMDVDQCPSCQGTWLSYDELDRLEDQEFSKDLDKGSLIFESQESGYKCPQCASKLRRFKYRLHDLKLDFCPNSHGFWLDRFEDKRILELMEEREEDIERKIEAEEEWEKTLRSLRSPGVFQRISSFFD